MPVIGITGGIATGKSTFTRSLLSRLPAELFDADQAAHQLLAGDAEVRVAIEQTFGPDIYDPSGQPDRARLRALAFSDEISRKRLEEILHPAIRKLWLDRASQVAEKGGWYCVDIPLLYETGAESHFDHIIVVACSPATQRHRLHHARGLDTTMAERIIAAQFDLVTKTKRADHLIWNDASVSSLHGQADLLAGWLRQRYG